MSIGSNQRHLTGDPDLSLIDPAADLSVKHRTYLRLKCNA